MTSAMPDMPMPPMPMKWMGPSFGGSFIRVWSGDSGRREFKDLSGKPLGRVDDARALGRCRRLGQALRVLKVSEDFTRQPLRRERILQDNRCRSDICKRLSIGGLVLIESAWKRHQDRRTPDGGKLGDG